MSRLNDDAKSSVNTTSLSNATLPNARAEGYDNYQLPITNPPIGAPKTNQDFVCLLWGEAEVRVAHYPLGTQK